MNSTAADLNALDDVEFNSVIAECAGRALDILQVSHDADGIQVTQWVGPDYAGSLDAAWALPQTGGWLKQIGTLDSSDLVEATIAMDLWQIMKTGTGDTRLYCAQHESPTRALSTAWALWKQSEERKDAT